MDHEEGQIRILQIMQYDDGKSNSRCSPDAGSVFLTPLISADTSFEMEDLIAALQETNSHRYFCH